MKHFLAISLVLSIVVLATLGCSNEKALEPESKHNEAPSLPSLSTMTIDLSLFKKAEVSKSSILKGNLSREMLTASQALKTNFLNAAVRVLFLDVVVYSALAEPVAAFSIAVQSVPQPQEDGSYLWTYIFVDDKAEYSIFLYGKPYENHVDWRMEVSSTDPEMLLEHFVWFDGTTYNDDSHGYWQFYEPAGTDSTGFLATITNAPTPGVPCIRIDWENISKDEHRLVFLVNKEGDPAEGSTLTFYESNSLCSVEFFDSAEGTTGNITWYPDGSGSITWPDYNNGEKACWDENQENVECVQE